MHSFVKRWNEPRLELKNWGYNYYRSTLDLRLTLVRTAPYGPCFILAGSKKNGAESQEEPGQLDPRTCALPWGNPHPSQEGAECLQRSKAELAAGKFLILLGYAERVEGYKSYCLIVLHGS